MTTQTTTELSDQARGLLSLIERFRVNGRIFVHSRRSGLRELERAGIITRERKGDGFVVTLVEATDD